MEIMGLLLGEFTTFIRNNMKVPQYTTAIALLSAAEQEDLYKKLILQLNKDLQYTNIERAFDPDLTPEALKTQLQELVVALLTDSASKFVSLMYRIDIAEQKIQAVQKSDLLETSEQIAFVILKREWQKVWFRNKL